MVNNNNQCKACSIILSNLKQCKLKCKLLKFLFDSKQTHRPVLRRKGDSAVFLN